MAMHGHARAVTECTPRCKCRTQQDDHMHMSKAAFTNQGPAQVYRQQKQCPFVLASL